MAEAIGWTSSILLLLTIGTQIHKQWQERTSAGVSVWLFAGQIAASAGFTLYSVLLHNRVFVVTNALMLASAIAGWALTLRQKKEDE